MGCDGRLGYELSSEDHELIESNADSNGQTRIDDYGIQ
jgi:hypothetical protein